jgi:U3 small nucleolar RNA-associated protein 19
VESKSFESSQLSNWTLEIYQSYQTQLFKLLSNEDSALQVGAVECYFNILKQQAIAGTNSQKKYYYPTIMHYRLVKQLFKLSQLISSELVNHFVEKFCLGFDDTRYHTYFGISKYFRDEFDREGDNVQSQVKLGFDILSMIRTFPSSNADIKNYWGVSPSALKETLPSAEFNHSSFELKGHKKVFTDAWVNLLKQPLSDEIFKRTLILIQKKILPNINQPLLMLDFLTISYDQGGVISLLALNGLFDLINTYHVDYPLFYEKLYKLLDWDLLHVKYRSRFFRLMELFLNSSHLAAYLVAAFIKRLSRLTLQAPPAGIVMVVPVIYNLLMKHPSCLSLIHRTSEILQASEDPFDFNEFDLSKTKAMDSSLWEIQTLTNHYHPTVSSLAKVFSEKMNKPNYPLEEFLDHTYNSVSLHHKLILL